MKVWASLAKPRQISYRASFLVSGLLLIVVATVSGIEESFDNWPGVSFFACLGVVLAIGGFFVSETRLQRVAYAFLWVNVAIAIVSLYRSWSK